MASNKFGAIIAYADNIRFASQRERDRYLTLRLLEQAGEIRDLVLQPRFALYAPVLSEEHGGVDQDKPPAWLTLCPGEYGPGCVAKKIGVMTLDFAYTIVQSGEVVLEDVKSGPTKTTAYRLRKRMLEATYGLVITEVEI